MNLSGVMSTFPPYGLFHMWHMYPSSHKAVCNAFSESSGEISSSRFSTLLISDDLTSSAGGTFLGVPHCPPPPSSLNGLCGRGSTARDDDVRTVVGGSDHRPPLEADNDGAPVPLNVTPDSSVTGQSAILEDGEVGVTNNQHVDADEIERSSERCFVAYAHCILAGTGTRAGKIVKFPIVSRMTKGSTYKDRDGTGGTRRTRDDSYEKILGVFEEGLRRYPKSTLLLYGASLALQVTQSPTNTVGIVHG